MSVPMFFLFSHSLAAAGATTPADAVYDSVPAFATSPASEEEVFMPHPFCTATKNAWTSSWTERRTVWSCVHDDNGRVLQFVTTSLVAVTEFCSERGQLERTEVVESFQPHEDAPEGTPPLCEPGVTVMHTEVIKGARFFESKAAESPLEVMPELLPW